MKQFYDMHTSLSNVFEKFKKNSFYFYQYKGVPFIFNKTNGATFAIWQFAETFFYLVDGKMFNTIFSHSRLKSNFNVGQT